MKNNNSVVIGRLINKSLKFNRSRNFFIILAITLTTLLIGSVFSMGMSLLKTKNTEQIRFNGTLAHAAVGHPSASQIEKLNKLDYVKAVGTGNNVAFVKNTLQMDRISLTLHYFDKTEWEKLRAPACTDIAGSYPQKENEIMVSLGVLKLLGISNPSIGMEIPLTYYTDTKNRDMLLNKKFRLSGWFASYALIKSMNMADTILVSKELSQKYGKTVEADGAATVMFDNPSSVSDYCEKLKSVLSLSKDQPVLQAQMYVREGGSTGSGLIALSAVTAFLILTGYLLIYNVLYISVSRDVRFYGLLKTLGTTPKQIRRIVIGQIMRLCMIGIPIGDLLALLLSLVVVPVSISKLSVASTGAVISFSPFIYLGAAFFALLTALLGAFKPARKAAGISPIEAQTFTGISYNRSHAYAAAHGKLYKMAFRNIFRDKKRAAVVLLSLFLGVTTFIAITTTVSSMSINHYVESMYESDFILKNNTLFNTEGPKQKFDQAFIKKLETLPGYEWLSTTTQELMRLEYSPGVFGEYITDLCKRNSIKDLTEENIQKNFIGYIVGINREALIKLNGTLDKPIDVDAFEHGEFALLAADNPDLFSNAHELSFSPLKMSKSGFKGKSGSKNIKISLGGFVPISFKNIGSSLAPTIFVSNSLMTKIYNEPIISQINIEVSNDCEQQALSELKQFTGRNHDISRISKLETLEKLNNAKTVLFVLGGGIALVIAVIGILNFVNVMSVSIMVRRHELATMESVGMSRKQVRKMLVGEGLGYALITLLLVFTAGTAITLGIFNLFRQQATYAVYTYPFIPVIIVSLAIAAICVITPEIAYHSIYKSTIVERLRET